MWKQFSGTGSCAPLIRATIVAPHRDPHMSARNPPPEYLFRIPAESQLVPLGPSLSVIHTSQSPWRFSCPYLKITPAMGWVDIIEEASQSAKKWWRMAPVDMNRS